MGMVPPDRTLPGPRKFIIPRVVRTAQDVVDPFPRELIAVLVFVSLVFSIWIGFR